MRSLLLVAVAAVPAAALFKVAEPASVPVRVPRRLTDEGSKWAPTQCGPGNQVTQWTSQVRGCAAPTLRRTACHLASSWPVVAQVSPTNALPEYPRPQLTRPQGSWSNLNGLWEFSPDAIPVPPFNTTLPNNILVPFPAEACLSGYGKTTKTLTYRLVFDSPFPGSRIILHFGAVDWQTSVYVNGVLVGNHTGGYDGFDLDVTAAMQATANELIVSVFDPSDDGYQPNGKQRISAIVNPGGDTYTPSSGIWQTVWLEQVPTTYVTGIRILADTQQATFTVNGAIVCADGASTICVIATRASPLADNAGGGNGFNIVIMDGGSVVAQASGTTGSPLSVPIPQPNLWHMDTPSLYNVSVALCTLTPCNNIDNVATYFGMRNVSLGSYTMPPQPPTGPQPGIDRPGDDLPGYPINIAADPNACWALCNKTAACQAWAYGACHRRDSDSHYHPHCLPFACASTQASPAAVAIPRKRSAGSRARNRAPPINLAAYPGHRAHLAALAVVPLSTAISPF